MRYYCEIVPFELAKKLKEAGYKEECSGHYAKDGHLWETHPKQNSNDTENFFSAPTYAEVFDWLISAGLSIEMQLEPNIKGWSCYICSVEGIRIKWAYFDLLSFHEAANAAIEKACELLEEE